MLDSDGLEDLTQVRKETKRILKRSIYEEKYALIESPPNSGKTTNAIRLSLESDTPVTYLSRRIDLYEQAEDIAEEVARKNEREVRYKRIPAPHRNCPTFRGENSGSVSAVKRLYKKGYSGREIHLRFPNETPCGKSCDYFQSLDDIDKNVDEIDLLIGNHSHANRKQYVDNRIVILDEFNSNPFLREFPDDGSNVIDTPGEIIPKFLDAAKANDDSFPSNRIRDITDLITTRPESPDGTALIDWFKETGADRRAGQALDFLNPELGKYDSVHTYAPLLAFSLLCMERIGPGIDLAPPPSGELDELWREVGLGDSVKCLRNRNTGEMYLLEAPDLSSAEQVLGLDGLPKKKLWNLLFASESGFCHRRVIDRRDYAEYLHSALNIELKQIGGGLHPYAGGNISRLDRERFEAVNAMEGQEFALISTKKALERYRKWGLLDKFVRKSDSQLNLEEQENRVSSGHQALHYSIIKSSNEFKKEELGVVAGMPFPSNDLVKIWAGFCGKGVKLEEEDGNKSFGDFGNQIYEHFAHDQVVQAALRFGRDESVYGEEGATVYLSTLALPDWFEVDVELTIEAKTKQAALLAKLLDLRRSVDKPRMALRTIRQIHDKIDADEHLPNVSKSGIRRALENLSSSVIEVEKDAGKRQADIFRLSDDANLLKSSDGNYFLRADNHIHSLKFDGNWIPKSKN
jgi:hypothetical protein